MTEQSLDQRLASLQRELPPGRDLWPEIEQRIGAASEQAGDTGRSMTGSGGQRARYGWWALAAGVLMLVGVSRVFLPEPVSINNDAGVDTLAQAAGRVLDAMEQSVGHTQSTPELLIANQHHGGWVVVPTGTSPMGIRIWQPELMAGIQENQQAIADLHSALEQQPQHTGLLQQLARAERRQHRLLRQWADFNASDTTGILTANTTNNSGEQHV